MGWQDGPAVEVLAAGARQPESNSQNHVKVEVEVRLHEGGKLWYVQT